MKTEPFNIVAITKARLNKKGRPAFFTKRGMKKAALRANKLRQAKMPFRYFLVPHPLCAKKEELRQLLDVLKGLDPLYSDFFITPEPGLALPTRGQFEYIRQRAAMTNSQFFIY